MDRVLVQKAEAVAKTKGGILIPEKAQSKVGFTQLSDYVNCRKDIEYQGFINSILYKSTTYYL